LLALLAAVALLGVACGGDDGAGEGQDTATTAAGPRLSGELRVFAAASLTKPFTEAGKAFEGAHPGAKVTFSFGPSNTLASQVNEGAPADVLATADEATMKTASGAGSVSAPRTFTRNRLAILVARGNPKQVQSLADLGKPGVIFVTCALQVPCGKFGLEALQKAGVTAKPISLEENVRAVASKVTLGEADAGIVYVTDVKAEGDKAQGVDIPDDQNVIATYPIGVVTKSAKADLARAWVDFVVSGEGQRILTMAGFASP
jgi:molybdate transport system substrate-binding protein